MLGYAYSEALSVFTLTISRRSLVKGVVTGLGGIVLSSSSCSRAAGAPKVVRVSDYVTSSRQGAEAIEAAIAGASGSGMDVVDFEGLTYIVESTVKVLHRGVSLANGGIASAGLYPALAVQAPDVTCRLMVFSRPLGAHPLASSSERSCVAVSGERFYSDACRYQGANMACLYLHHGVSDGAVVRGGEMTGTAQRQDACGIYAAAGPTGNRSLTVDGVEIYGTTQGILLFDTAESVVRNNIVRTVRKLPDVELGGWVEVGGGVWRQRSATGDPNTSGVATDRDDGNTRVVTVNGQSLGEVAIGSARPATNKASIDGGYVYINLGDLNPNDVKVTSGILSGYAYMIYATSVNEHLCHSNRFLSNTAEDVDGFGIYFALGVRHGAHSNEASGNVLRNVCRSGVQHSSLVFSGIGVSGGSGTLIRDNLVDGVGTTDKPVPGIRVSAGGSKGATGGSLVRCTVRNSTGDGFSINSSGWLVDGCTAVGNSGIGFLVWTNVPDSGIERVTLRESVSSHNDGDGFCVDGKDPSVSITSVVMRGGKADSNGRSGLLLISSPKNSVRNCIVHSVDFSSNGVQKYPQISVGDNCVGTVIEQCSIRSQVDGASGLKVSAGARGTISRNNFYRLGNPANFQAPVQSGS